jgi:Fe-S cluster assembly ATP-binding protein
LTGLAIRDLTAGIGTSQIIRGLDLEVPYGEIHALMGPNGSGKSTLCHVLTGHPRFEARGTVALDETDLLGLDVDERARRGVLQAFQYPTEIPGVKLRDLLVEAGEERGIPPEEMTERIERLAPVFSMEPFLERAVNDELSGGEKKRSELFQLAVLQPRVALLDEIDSGLDIDAVRQVAEAVKSMRAPDVAVLMITHYSRILRYVIPDRIHVMVGGRIVESGGPELADRLEAEGYEAWRE